MLLTPYEIQVKTMGEYRNLARSMVDRMGAEAYNLKIFENAELAVAVEHELAMRDYARGLHTLTDFARKGDCAEKLRSVYVPFFAKTQGVQHAAMEFEMARAQDWHYSTHEATGKHVYEVSDALAMRLKHTTLRGVRTNDLTLPHKSIAVILPPAVVDVCTFSDRPDHRLNGFMIVEDTPNLKQKDAGFALSQRALEPIKGYNEDFEGRVWRVLAFSGVPGEDQEVERLQHYFIPLPNGATLDEVLSRIPEDIVGWRDILKWVMNVAIYAQWPEADKEHVIADDAARKLWEKIERTPKGPKKDKLKSEFKQLEPLRRIYLGRHTPPWKPPEDYEPGTGKPLMVRTKVDGHWQRYHTGKGRTQTVWKHVPPYWKGPLDAPVSSESARHVLTAPKN